MGKRRADPRRSKQASSRFRSRKVIAVIAGTAAVAVLAVVLVLANTGTPGNDVVATVNGHPITASDVENRQFRHSVFYDEQIDFSRALEQLINEELAYQQAVPDYRVDRDEAERELEADLARDELTLEWLKAQLEASDIVYDEYLETFRRDMVINMYIDDAIAVTEEQAIERYEQLAEEYAMMPGMELPPYEEVRAHIIAELEDRNLGLLVAWLRQEADVVRYTD